MWRDGLWAHVESVRWVRHVRNWFDRLFRDLTAGCLGIGRPLGGVRRPQTLLRLRSRVCDISSLQNKEDIKTWMNGKFKKKEKRNWGIWKEFRVKLKIKWQIIRKEHPSQMDARIYWHKITNNTFILLWKKKKKKPKNFYLNWAGRNSG